MEKWCEKLAYYFYQKSYIQFEDVNALRFAFELYITQFITFFTMFIIGIYLDKVIETIIYSLFFSMLRKRVNGYHAMTFLGCYFLSIISFVIIILLSSSLVPFYLLNILFIIYIIYYFKIHKDNVMNYINIGYILLVLLLFINQNIYYLNLVSLIYYTVMLLNLLREKENESSNY